MSQVVKVKINSPDLGAPLRPSTGEYLWAQWTTMLSNHDQSVGTRFNEPLKMRQEIRNDVRGDRDSPAPCFRELPLRIRGRSPQWRSDYHITLSEDVGQSARQSRPSKDTSDWAPGLVQVSGHQLVDSKPRRREHLKN
jgi:hypothetical protein